MSSATVPPLYDIVIAPRWADQDSLGHINNVAYFRFAEEARVQWSHGLSDQLGIPRPIWMLVDSHMNYKRQWHHPNSIRVVGRVLAIGNSSFSLSHTLVPEGGGAVIAEGSVKMVHADPGSLTASPISSQFRAYLQRHLPSGA